MTEHSHLWFRDSLASGPVVARMKSRMGGDLAPSITQFLCACGSMLAYRAEINRWMMYDIQARPHRWLLGLIWRKRDGVLETAMPIPGHFDSTRDDPLNDPRTRPGYVPPEIEEELDRTRWGVLHPAATFMSYLGKGVSRLFRRESRTSGGWEHPRLAKCAACRTEFMFHAAKDHEFVRQEGFA